VLQDQPQKIFAFERSIASFAGTAIHISKGDVAVYTGEDIVFREDASVQIARQVFQGAQALADMGTMDDPFGGHGLWGVEPFLVQGLEKSCAKHLGQGEGIEEILCLFLFPLFSFLIDSAPGHDDMDMWVIVQAPVMSMEDCSYADMGAEVFGV